MSLPQFPLVTRAGVNGCGATEATGNPRVLSANRVELWLFLFHKYSNFTPLSPTGEHGGDSDRKDAPRCAERAAKQHHYFGYESVLTVIMTIIMTIVMTSSFFLLTRVSLGFKKEH